MRRYLGAFLLTGALCMPFAVQMQAHDDHDRYYDRDHKDYHNWNAEEDRHWHEYLKERHMKDHDWAKASAREQQQYWAWRHDHPDAH